MDETPLIDTHEHLLEEEDRLRWSPDSRVTKELGLFPSDDWSYVFWQYLPDDFGSAGMSLDEWTVFFDPEASTQRKFAAIAPWWERCKHTGYGQAVRITLKGLYGLDDLTAETAPILAERYKEAVRPGFYKEILREKCNIEHCQVNSLQAIFMESSQPDLLRQDIACDRLSTGITRELIEEHRSTCLDDWLDVVYSAFERFGPHAVAIKNPCAYFRRLDFSPPDQSEAERAFSHLTLGDELDPVQRKALEDFLFDVCVSEAVRFQLPVKLHTGYMAGLGYMPIDQVRQNYSDLCSLLERRKDAKFVLVHIGFPYWTEATVVAKHYPNAFIDMCWAWILSPAVSCQFLKEFLLAAPANKVLPFGGDYFAVEPIYGHSKIARRGMAQVINEVVCEGWVRPEEAKQLIERIMNGNAKELFRC